MVDIITQHCIVVIDAVAANVDEARTEKRTPHAVGDGAFIVDGEKLNRRKERAAKLPAGI